MAIWDAAGPTAKDLLGYCGRFGFRFPLFIKHRLAVRIGHGLVVGRRAVAESPFDMN